jgi:uncharacterized protein (TIGR02118 family)
VPKYIALVKRPLTESAAPFLAELRERANLVALESNAGLSRLVLDSVDVPPEEAGLRSGGSPAFDAVLELWSEDDGSAREVCAELAATATADLYRVTEKVEKERVRDWPSGIVTPGIKSIYLARRKDGMTHEAMARHWAETHAPLALKHHIGMWRYVRNTVEDTLTPVADPWDGFAELHFRTSDDLINRMFDSYEGRAAIMADIAKFSGPGKVLHTHEHILIE